MWWSSLKKSDQIELFTQQAARAGVGKNRGFKFGRRINDAAGFGVSGKPKGPCVMKGHGGVNVLHERGFGENKVKRPLSFQNARSGNARAVFILHAHIGQESPAFGVSAGISRVCRCAGHTRGGDNGVGCCDSLFNGGFVVKGNPRDVREGFKAR